MGDIMRKILAISLITILVPYLIVTFFIKDEQIKIDYVSNIIVRVKRVSKNIISEIPLEDYVIHVVSGEMPITFQEEALKAQAIAARTYVIRKMKINSNNDYDVVDTISDQVYIDDDELKNKWKTKYDEYLNKIKKIVIDTKGLYLTYNDEIIEPLFFSTSSGKTENSEEVFQTALPYLRSVDSSWDNISPVFNDLANMSLADFYTKLNLPYNETLNIKIISYNASGSIKTISINNKSFSGKEVRNKLALRSSNFQIEKDNSNVKIKTKGYGHGVGMSQYGAEAMAKNKKNYEEILKYYYSGVEIKKI